MPKLSEISPRSPADDQGSPRGRGGVGQELRVEELLRGAGQLELEPGDGKGAGRVVLPVVVVVLEEEDGGRAEVGAVDRDDLGIRRREERRLVGRGEDGCGEIEVRDPRPPAQRPGELAAPAVEIPVDVVAVGDGRVGPEGEGPAEEAAPDGGGEVPAPLSDPLVAPLGAPGAGEEEEAEPGRVRPRRREGGERPGLAEEGPVRRDERERLRRGPARGPSRRTASTSRPCRSSGPGRCGDPTPSEGAAARGSVNDALRRILESLTVGRRWRTRPASHSWGSRGTGRRADGSSGARARRAAPIAPAQPARNSLRSTDRRLAMRSLSLSAGAPRSAGAGSATEAAACSPGGAAPT